MCSLNTFLSRSLLLGYVTCNCCDTNSKSNFACSKLSHNFQSSYEYILFITSEHYCTHYWSSLGVTLFLNPHLITYHSKFGVQITSILDLSIDYLSCSKYIESLMKAQTRNGLLLQHVEPLAPHGFP
jgi:hypothetical protein